MRNLLLVVLVCLFVSLPLEAQQPIVGSVPQKGEDRFVPFPDDLTVETWVSDLEVPWELLFLPDRALVTERPGRIRLIKDGKLENRPYLAVPVHAVGEGGLMGLAAPADFPTTNFIYAMFTYQEGGQVFNKIVRIRDLGQTGAIDRVLMDRIPGSINHNGGRLAFGPDGKLYAATGDTNQSSLAQDWKSPAGKILRMNPDGSIPADNPFPNSPVWSLGHRNPQGLAWHPKSGELFSSEHGPSGEFGLRDRDEINIIRKGLNYGWPRVVGAAGLAAFEDPLIMWPRATPPGGVTFWNGYLIAATLRSQALIRIGLDPREQGGWSVVSLERLYARNGTDGVYGRLRDAVVGPDGALYVLTSNRDGRGSVRGGDDKILRIAVR